MLLAGLVLLTSSGCVNSSVDEPITGTTEPASVDVELERELARVEPHAFGIHTSVYDNELDDPGVPELLRAAGITMIRYPGGGYSDNYHWSAHEMTPWCNGDPGYLADNTDFGSYVPLLDQFAGIITVNYGSNLAGDGPGEPKEAAAWVAYANGAADDETEIGLDSAGNDWRTVGFWAGLRSSPPLENDDGYNFLRVNHPAPLGIRYWEVGNEVFGNGYYGQGNEFEFDLHASCDAGREGHEALSPSAYGANVRDFVREMKAVDPSIEVGAVLNTPPFDYRWGPTWNDDVLAQCADVIDFGIVHWYAEADLSALTTVARDGIPDMIAELRADFETHAGARASEIEIFVTELGTRAQVPRELSQITGLFAANAYATFMAHGVAHIDWLELHNGSFLSERNLASRGPAYHGIQMVHLLAEPGDALVRAGSDRSNLVVHAARRADGTAAVLLSNGSRILTRNVTVTGLDAPRARRYDYFPRPPTDQERAEDPERLTAYSGRVVEGGELEASGGRFLLDLPPNGMSLLIGEP